MSAIQKLKVVTFSMALSLFLYMGYFVAFAFIPQFSVGQTINPGCGPTDPTCTVAPLAIGDYIKNSTPGSVLFADSTGLLGQDNDNFYWDTTHASLGVGTTTPLARVQVEGDTHASLDPFLVTVDGIERFKISNTEIRFFDAYTFPKDTGVLSQVLTTDGNGVLSWQYVPQSLIGSTTSLATETWLGEGAGSLGAATVDTVFVGTNTGRGATSAKKSSFVGVQAGMNATAAGYANFFGFNAGSNAGTAQNSIFIGINAGQNDTVDNTMGGTSILIGDNTNTGGFSNSIALGAEATNTAANQFLIAPTYTSFNMRGINWVMPSAQGGAGQVLTNDGSGGLSWTTVSGATVGLIGSTSGITNAPLAPGGSETWLGHLAGSAASMIGTTFIGLSTGSNATNADYSNFVGFYAGQNASGAQQANFIGFRAGLDATNAAASNFIGADAGNTASNAILSNFIGASAGQYATYASHANFFGGLSGKDATNASYSTFLGYNAGFAATNAANSIFIGTNAGQSDTVDNTPSGTYEGASILIGNNTSTGGFSNSIALGRSATNTAMNQFMIGAATSPITQVRINGAAGTQCTITTGTGMACTSDERMKTDISALKEVLPLLQKVQTVTYLWKDVPNTPVQIGFLAQNLEEVFPEVVTTDSEGYKSVYYSQMTPILTKAVQELNAKIDLLAASAGLSTETLFATMTDVVVKNLTDLKEIAVKRLTASSGFFDTLTSGIIESSQTKTKELCVEDVCVTKEQFKRMVEQSNAYTPTSSVGTQTAVDATQTTENPALEPEIKIVDQPVVDTPQLETVTAE